MIGMDGLLSSIPQSTGGFVGLVRCFFSLFLFFSLSLP